MINRPDLSSPPSSSAVRSQNSSLVEDDRSQGGERFSALLSGESEDLPTEFNSAFAPEAAAYQPSKESILVSRPVEDQSFMVMTDETPKAETVPEGSIVILDPFAPVVAADPKHHTSIADGSVPPPSILVTDPSPSSISQPLTPGENSSAAMTLEPPLDEVRATPQSGVLTNPALIPTEDIETEAKKDATSVQSVGPSVAAGVNSSGEAISGGYVEPIDQRPSVADVNPAKKPGLGSSDQVTGPTAPDFILTPEAGKGDQNASPSGLSVSQAPSSSTSPSSVTPPAANSATTLPTPVVHIASPARLPEIIADHLGADDDRQDRILVQLDPPELGRVSVEFKFDAQGLQTVTVSGETSEAMRRLRSMHADLVQALQQQGLPSENLTFSQQQSREREPQYSVHPDLQTTSMQAPLATYERRALQSARPLPHSVARLDIKV